MSSAAALALHPRRQPTTVPPGPGPSGAPRLRVLEGGRAPSQVARRAAYRRRRLAAAALLVAVSVATLLLVNAVLARTAGGGTPTSAAGASAAVYVVQPGDTLWSIAQRLHPTGDVRLVVDQLTERNGRGPLVVGQRLELP